MRAPPVKNLDGVYDWVVTKHVTERWAKRFPNSTQTLLECLEGSRKLSAKRKRHLQSLTPNHAAQFEPGSGYFFRCNNDIVFVLDDLIVVTVYNYRPQDLKIK